MNDTNDLPPQLVAEPSDGPDGHKSCRNCGRAIYHGGDADPSAPILWRHHVTGRSICPEPLPPEAFPASTIPDRWTCNHGVFTSQAAFNDHARSMHAGVDRATASDSPEPVLTSEQSDHWSGLSPDAARWHVTDPAPQSWPDVAPGMLGWTLATLLIGFGLWIWLVH